MKTEFKNGKPTIKDIKNMCGGTLICSGLSENSIVSSICTDSREASSQTVFVAICGERVDGHDYIAKTIKGGCPFSIASKIPDMSSVENEPYAIVLVEDTLKAIGQLAHEYKKRVDPITVGVTGSVGKTTTKEFVSSVLCEKYKTFKTEGNHNSTIGLPMSIMEMTSDVGAAVLEMGMSDFGEISQMTNIARPNIAIVTNIGTSHMEHLGSRENICRAKMEIAEGLCDDGILLLNGDEPLLVGADKGGHKTIYVSLESRDADARALNIREEFMKTTFDMLYEGKIYSNIELPVMGKHNIYAALFAFVAGKICGMDDEDIRRGLMSYRSVGMRQNIYDLCGITLIEDCYNASPESMRSAIDVLSELSKQKGNSRKVALLGDMLELGERSEELHRGVGEYLAVHGCDLLFTYGEKAENIASSAIKHGMKTENVHINREAGAPENVGNKMLALLCHGDILLVKASRSMAAEKIIEFLKDNKDKLPK